jgi:hypothetical protein
MINPDDPQIGLVRRGNLGEVRRFLPTWSAPLRPDIDHHRLPAQSGEPNRTAAAKARQHHIWESGRDRSYLRIRRRTVGNVGRLLHCSKIGRRRRARCSLARRRHGRTRFGNRRRPTTTSKHHREDHDDCGCQPASAPRPKFPTSADFLTSGGPSRCRISDQCGFFDLGSQLEMSNFRPVRTFRPRRSSVCDRAARSRHLHPRGSRTSFAALAGLVSPSPYEGHKRATGQAPQAGFRA